MNISWTFSQIVISGRVTDCEGEPVIGAYIGMNHSNIYTTSDYNGLYKIEIPERRVTLKYSYVGLVTQKIKVGNSDTINVVLNEDTSAIDNQIIVVKKPVIYLYPITKTDISLKINYTGKFLYTYPKYNNGWNVIANSDGTLIDKSDGREYSYLFWEGEMKYDNNENIYNDGFTVSNDSIIPFLQKKLAEIGLTSKEYNDFIVFWMPYLCKNQWNFIHFRVGQDYNTISNNTVNPKPDTEIRVFMEFKKIDKPFEVEPQKIMTPTRGGFTLVEWGGSELNNQITIKTKSGKNILK